MRAQAAGNHGDPPGGQGEAGGAFPGEEAGGKRGAAGASAVSEVLRFTAEGEAPAEPIDGTTNNLEERFGLQKTVSVFDASPEDHQAGISIMICSTLQVIASGKSSVVIGRGEQADITLDQPTISRMYCRVTALVDGRYSVEDLNSSNGTYVTGVIQGGKRVSKSIVSGAPCVVESGAIIQAGGIDLQIVKK